MRLIEDFPIALPSGVTLRGSLYQSPHRDTGRRIIVRDDSGNKLHDTDWAYDTGNAQNSLDSWLERVIALTCVHAIVGLCPACQEEYYGDPSAYWEYGDHQAGIANWKALQEEMARSAAESLAAPSEPDPNIPF